MTGLIQRLLDRAGGNTPAAAPVTPATTSGSPLAAHDQRLQHAGFRDAGLGLPDISAAPPTDDIGPDAPSFPPIPHPRVATPQPDAPNVMDPPTPQPLIWQDIPDPIAALRGQGPQVPNVAPVLPAQEVITEIAPAPTPIAPSKPPNQDNTTAPATPPKIDPYLPDIPNPLLLRQPALQPVDPVASPMMPESRSPDLPTPDAPPSVTPLPTVEPTPSAPAPPIEAAPAPVAPAPAEARQEPVLIRPAAPQRALPEMPEPRRDTAIAQPAATQARAVERLVEKVVARDTPAQPDRRMQPRPAAPTAQSVSRIGSLPTRRRVHTIFGLRRG